MTKRLFFALWPNRTLRQHLLRVQGECLPSPITPPSPAANLHLTLAFLGQVETAQQACLEQGAAGLHLPAFSFRLDRLGYWRKPRILWIGCSATPAALHQLAAALAEVMRSCGLQPEARPYRPHVTLARKQKQGPETPLPLPSLHWEARDFVLAESVSRPGGVLYRILQRWPLLIE